MLFKNPPQSRSPLPKFRSEADESLENNPRIVIAVSMKEKRFGEPLPGERWHTGSGTNRNLSGRRGQRPSPRQTPGSQTRDGWTASGRMSHETTGHHFRDGSQGDRARKEMDQDGWDGYDNPPILEPFLVGQRWFVMM